MRSPDGARPEEISNMTTRMGVDCKMSESMGMQTHWKTTRGRDQTAEEC